MSNEVKPLEGLNPASSAILNQVRDRALLFPETKFFPSETKRISVHAPSVFAGRHLVVESSLAKDDTFHLLDIQIGKNSQTAAALGAIDTKSFAPWPADLMGKLVERADAHEVTTMLANLGLYDTAQTGMYVTLIVNRPNGEHTSLLGFKAKLYGDWEENEVGPVAASHLRKRETRTSLLPFNREFQESEIARVGNQPQMLFKGSRLIYAGPPKTFVLHDILVGWHSFWKEKGKQPTPLEEFAPIPPTARETIMNRGGLAEIENAIYNAKLGITAPAQEVNLLIECVAKPGAKFSAYLVGDVIE